MLNSYPSIYNLGHAAIADLLKVPVIVEEKVDGSQISFGKREDDGRIEMRSKGAEINVIAPEGMFALGVEAVKRLDAEGRLAPGVTFRGEYLCKPKHNALAYNRVPKDNIILFDINFGLEFYESPGTKRYHAGCLGLECVPVLFEGIISDVDQLRTLLDRESVLGGQKIEGVVIKPANYDVFGKDKKCLMGKFVSEAYREVHANSWTKEHKTPGSADILALLANRYTTATRWHKAEQHLRDAGKIESSMRDIPHLFAEVPKDIEKECEDEIKDYLYSWAWPQLRRMVTRGLPEWYKEELLKRQFDGQPVTNQAHVASEQAVK